MTEHRIVLPFTKPPLTPNQRLHFARKAALTAEIRQAATWCAKAAKLPPMGRSAVTTVWFPPDRRRRDANSLVLTAKAAIDGLVDFGVWDDDDPTHVASETYRIGPVDRTNPRIEILIRPDHFCWVCRTDLDPATAADRDRHGCGPQCHDQNGEQP